MPMVTPDNEIREGLYKLAKERRRSRSRESRDGKDHEKHSGKETESQGENDPETGAMSAMVGVLPPEKDEYYDEDVLSNGQVEIIPAPSQSQASKTLQDMLQPVEKDILPLPIAGRNPVTVISQEFLRAVEDIHHVNHNHNAHHHHDQGRDQSDHCDHPHPRIVHGPTDPQGFTDSQSGSQQLYHDLQRLTYIPEAKDQVKGQNKWQLKGQTKGQDELIKNEGRKALTPPEQTLESRDAHASKLGVSKGNHMTTSIGHFHIVELEQNDILLGAERDDGEDKDNQDENENGQGITVPFQIRHQKGDICDAIILTQETFTDKDGHTAPFVSSYKVGASLRYDWRVQATFFSRIVLIKAVQLLFINIAILCAWLLPDVQKFFRIYHNWFYMAVGCFAVLFLFVRVVARKRSNWHPIMTLVFFVLMTIPITYALVSVTHTYKVYCVPLMTATLFLTLVTMSCVPYVTQNIISKPVVVCTGVILAILYSLALLVVSFYTMKEGIDITKLVTTVWFPGVIMAEIILWILMFEIQRVITGYCFNVSEWRWFFASLYL